jgi:hypothetical protein
MTIMANQRLEARYAATTARLRTRTTILRALASTFAMPGTQEQLLALAARCEELAKANPPTDMSVAETT